MFICQRELAENFFFRTNSSIDRDCRNFHGHLVFFPNALYLLQENKINFFLYLGNLVQ